MGPVVGWASRHCLVAYAILEALTKAQLIFSYPMKEISMELFAFVLMPFAKTYNRRYEAIKRAIRRADMTGTRVDEQSFHRQGIPQKVLQQIEEADVIIADMSTNNSKVLYEVGYSHAKPFC